MGGHKLNLEGFSFMVIRMHATTSRSQQLGIMCLEVPKNLQHWLKGKSTGYSKSAWSQTCKKTCENHENPLFILVKLFPQTSLPIESSIVFHILKSLQCAEGAEFRGPGWYCKDRLDVKKTDLIVPWKKRGIWE